MKAYYLTLKDDDEGVVEVVFANTAKEAKKLVWTTYLPDYFSGDNDWINLRVNRANQFDGMENLTDKELHTIQWHEGWRWIDRYDMPSPEEATDEDFHKWYDTNILDSK